MPYPSYYPAQSTEPGTLYSTPLGRRAEIIDATYPWVKFRRLPDGRKLMVMWQDFFRTYRQVVDGEVTTMRGPRGGIGV